MKKLFWIAAVGAVAYGVNHPSLLTSYAKNKVSDTITQKANQVFEKATQEYLPSTAKGSRSTQGTADPYADLVGRETDYPRIPEAGQGTPRNACPGHEGLLAGMEPKIARHIADRSDYTVLCNSQYVNASIGATKTGFWSAWRLDKEGIERTRGLRREDSFRPDERLPENARASLEDYRGSGYDRGHIFPNADGNSVQSRSESYLLSNIFPQSAAHNQEMWNELEQRTRKLAIRNGEIYVVTGVAFLGKKAAQIGNTGLYVPSHVYKAVYIPSKDKAAACLSVNAAAAKCRWVNIEELTQITGTNPFPALLGTMAAKTVFSW